MGDRFVARMGEGRGEREIAKEQNFNSKKKMVAPAMH